MNTQELKDVLAQCYGTEGYTRYMGGLLLTDGAVVFAENAGGGAYWFLDIVWTELLPINKTEPFMSVILSAKGDKADITATDGNDKPLFTKHIGFTDCPDGDWGFYLIDGVFLITQEY
jgi:hypothetical protein